jgi:hypothetical protein
MSLRVLLTIVGQPADRKYPETGFREVKSLTAHNCLLQSPARGNSMTNLGGVVQMLRKEHDRLSKEMDAIRGALSAFGAAYGKGTARRGKISAAGRARIAAAQRARWAKVRAGSGANVVAMPKRRKMSASARRRIAAAQRARWAKVKATKKTT